MISMEFFGSSFEGFSFHHHNPVAGKIMSGFEKRSKDASWTDPLHIYLGANWGNQVEKLSRRKHKEN